MKIYDNRIFNDKSFRTKEEIIRENEKKYIENIFDWMDKLLVKYIAVVSREDCSRTIPFKKSLSYLGKYQYIFNFIDSDELTEILKSDYYNYSSSADITIRIIPATGEFKIDYRINNEYGDWANYMFFITGETNHYLIKTKVDKLVSKIEEMYSSDFTFNCYANDTLKEDSEKFADICEVLLSKEKDEGNE